MALSCLSISCSFLVVDAPGRSGSGQRRGDVLQWDVIYRVRIANYNIGLLPRWAINGNPYLC